MNPTLLLRLYWEFFKTGLLAVGGGPATLPFLANMADRTGWFTTSQLADMIAVSESTPGPLGINVATYVGYTTSGIIGGIVSTLGLITPSLIVVLMIAGTLQKYNKSKFIKTIFYFLKPVSLALITSSLFSLCLLAFFKNNTLKTFSNINPSSVILAIVLIACSRYIPKVNQLHPIAYIALSAIMGILIF